MRLTTKGQSLVEVVVGIGMMAMLLVALLSLVALSVKNSRLARDRTKAVALAQEGVELMRTYRDFSWTEFSVSGVSSLPDGWVVADGLTGGSCDEADYMDSDNFYSRCVDLIFDDISAVDVEVTVYWQEGSRLNSLVQTTKLSLWER